MKDKKILKWLEENMNKQHLFYFKDNEKDKDIIDCYYKKNDRHFCTFYRPIVLKCMSYDLKIVN